MSNQVRSLWLVTSTTSVSPSQRPRESPIQNGSGVDGPAAVRVDQPEHLLPFERHRDVRRGVWKIWNGYSMYMMRGTPGR